MKIIGKKFLINEWRDTTLPKISGIYKIVNKINGKYYVGSSCNIFGENGRWSKHSNELIKNTHYNIHLQRAWNKYGMSSFEFIVVEITDSLHEIEQIYLDQAKKDDVYNMKFSPSGGGQFSDEVLSKISDAHKKRWSTIEYREKIIISYANARKKPGYLEKLKERNKKSWTDDRRSKKSISAKKQWDINKQWMGGNGSSHPRYDTTIYTFYNNINSETFVGTKYEFYTKYKLDKSKVYRLLSGERKKHKGWIVKPSTSSLNPPSYPLE